jgi:aminoglycoside N3'-acetyltransferase
MSAIAATLNGGAGRGAGHETGVVRRAPFTPDELVADLRRLGVAAGDLVMPHASLRAIGPVEGGAAGVVAALDAAVGAEGTLLMTIGARDDWAWVNEHPEPERARLLAGSEPFDAATAPSDPDNGVLAEVFRTTPETRVSDHPEGRFAARGADAAALVNDVPWDDYYGPGSPLARFVERRGKVLRLGADIGTVTAIHYAEYLADVPDKIRVRRHRLVTTPTGPAVVVVEGLDDDEGIVRHPGPDYFGVILEAYLATGAAQEGQIGGARSELIDAGDIVAFAARWMTQRFGALAAG